MNGRFFVLEGIDGSGKSTQLRLLAQRVQAAGIPCLTTCEPTGGPMGKLLRQTLADMNGQIVQSSFTMKVVIPETPVPVLADGQRLYRVFQNLLQNALYYSLEGSRIFLTLTEEGGLVIVRMKNTSSVELTDSKDFTERFVRGDESRTDGGSGLGLSIAKSFTQACGGDLTVETDADLFTVTVSFRKAEAVPSVEEESREA